MEAAIDATLRRLAREGFPRAQVDAVVHQIELDEREVSPSPNPNPLTLTLTLTRWSSGWTREGRPTRCALLQLGVVRP